MNTDLAYRTARAWPEFSELDACIAMWKEMAIRYSAMRTAALVLTRRPVCVLGAREASVDDRLQFIDTVMAMLPYGIRTRMSAATWTRATFRGHKSGCTSAMRNVISIHPTTSYGGVIRSQPQ
jgi:hypothetical protein